METTASKKKKKKKKVERSFGIAGFLAERRPQFLRPRCGKWREDQEKLS